MDFAYYIISEVRDLLRGKNGGVVFKAAGLVHIQEINQLWPKLNTALSNIADLRAVLLQDAGLPQVGHQLVETAHTLWNKTQ